ncbi:uncharacterized protein B0H18DRAFT_1122978 [Fomitopsis serialis]|uniref:uncharacterized protein n=1 Tax=Fomitopsis serialis TaxID=139415 RepID=UPI0020085415|nr:uncharacterized protein B0H18DRAFT_1122978 [Neoantrodia serialis]KAH9918622.1 hypothetical protein B0H18DRAFT_1122978 [Neoantrodia serialis]
MTSPSRIPAPRRSTGGPQLSPAHCSAPPSTPNKEQYAAQEDPSRRIFTEAVNGCVSPSKLPSTAISFPYKTKKDTALPAGVPQRPPFTPRVASEPDTENQPTHDPALTHARRQSIPKSPRKVFHFSTHRQAPQTDSSPTEPAPLVSLVPSVHLNDAPSAVSTGPASCVRNSASVCIPSPGLTGPCLLAPTPSFVAVHAGDGAVTLLGGANPDLHTAKERKGRKGWLRAAAHSSAAPAKESLMLATPSFIALGNSNSMASFASKYSIWHGRRGQDARKAGTSKGGESGVAARVLSSSREAAVIDDPRLETHEGDVFNPVIKVVPQEPEEEDCVVGLPKDMLDTLKELEAVAELIKDLPVPASPQRPVPASSIEMQPLQDTGKSHTVQDIAVPNASPHSEQRDPQASDDAANKLQLMSKATPAASPTKLPRVARMPLGRAVSSPLTPARSQIPAAPRRAFSDPSCTPKTLAASRLPSASATPTTPKTSTRPTMRTPGVSGTRSIAAVKPNVPNASIEKSPARAAPKALALPTPVQTPRTSGVAHGPSKLRTVFKPRVSEPVRPVTSSLRKVSPAIPVSRIARKARHSEVAPRTTS